MQIILRALTRVPLSLLYAWSWVLYFVAFRVVRWRREQVERDVAISLAESTPKERARIVRESYRRAADTVVEMLWGFGASAPALLGRVEFENPEVIERFGAARQPVVLLTPHYCNWEWLYLAGGARFGFPIDTVYQPHRVAAVEAFLRESRARFGGKPIPRKEFVYELMNSAGEVRGYSMIADQTPRREDRKHWTRFLGRDTAFYVGADQIAKFLDAPVLYVAMRRLRRGYYSVRFDVLAAPPYDESGHEVIIERFARRAEEAVIESPADFLWIQKRWKYPRPDDE